jgi:hypothetical protein
MSAIHTFYLNLLFGQGELAHRALKAYYPLTSKLDTPAQLAKHEHRRRVLRRTAEAGRDSYTNIEQALGESPAGLKDHHYIPTLSRNNSLYIFSFLRSHANDPALTVGVGLRILCISLTMSCRSSYRNSRTMYYTDFETWTSTIATMSSQMRSAIWSLSQTIGYTRSKQCR